MKEENPAPARRAQDAIIYVNNSLDLEFQEIDYKNERCPSVFDLFPGLSREGAALMWVLSGAPNEKAVPMLGQPKEKPYDGGEGDEGAESPEEVITLNYP